MVRKILLALLMVGSTFGATLMELLDTVQRLVTEYETTGKALQEPYIYARLTSYYEVGRLYTAYAMEKQAIDMLSMASCSALPTDCRYYKYFLKHITRETYQKSLKTIPTVLGELEAYFDAYAEWWINKHFTDNELYKEYKNLEAQLKEKFLNSWKAFLKASPQPAKFLISKWPKGDDLFLVTEISVAYYLGWIKRIVFYGDWESYRYLVANGYLPSSAKFVPYKDRQYNYIHLYRM